MQEYEGEETRLEFEGSVRAKPQLWDLDFVADAFAIPGEGQGLKHSRSVGSEHLFAGAVDNRVGWAVSKCLDSNFRIILEFLVPIFHPKRPSMVPVHLASTLWASWMGERKVNWGLLLRNAIMSQLRSLQPGRITYLPVYLEQLYWYGDCLLPKEARNREIYLKGLPEFALPISSDDGDEVVSDDESDGGGKNSPPGSPQQDTKPQQAVPTPMAAARDVHEERLDNIEEQFERRLRGEDIEFSAHLIRKLTYLFVCLPQEILNEVETLWKANYEKPVTMDDIRDEQELKGINGLAKGEPNGELDAPACEDVPTAVPSSWVDIAVDVHDPQPAAEPKKPAAEPKKAAPQWVDMKNLGGGGSRR